MGDIRIGIVGCAGRMGRALIRQVHETEGCTVASGVEPPGSPYFGQDLGDLAQVGALGLTVGDDPEALISEVDVVIDFSAPEATVAHARLAAEHGTAHIAGTTGLTPEQDAVVADAATKTAIVRAANMSLGVNLLLALTRKVAGILSDDFDIEIVEMHHRHKVDAPSGTALALGQAAAAGRHVDHDTVADRGRDGITGARQRGHIGYAVLRGGNVAGEHAVVFAADDERVELVHKAGDRTIFARGAVTAALWVHGKAPGLYGMDDVLALDL